MIVDDHRVLSELLSSALSAHDDIAVVGTAGTAAEALRTLSLFRPDVVLLDYDLPDDDGVSLIGPIRELSPHTQILMLTSYTDPIILSEAIDAGCAGFITKRSSTDEIAAAVLAVRSDQTPVSPDMVRSIVAKDHNRVGSDLTAREVEVLRLAAKGLSNKEIAEQLFLSVNTVRNHMQRVLNKLGAHSKLEATAIAVRLGIVRR
jgi:DNA-binding NarL/FixJ family response regulator